MTSGADSGPRIYAVGEVLGGLRRMLEDRVGRLWIVGELSNLHVARSGHIYFSLKDDRGQLRAAMFRSSARSLAFEPEDGLEVLVYADVSLYEERGDLQLIVRRLEPRGLGALQLAFEQLRARLDAEGLFASERKRAIPERPARIGVVTSPTGAALRDVLEVAGRRFPAAAILISPTRVQGAEAAREIAAALDALGTRSDVDVVLLVRGGGSLEDLEAFNSEQVARAVVRSPVPVISGVGHEVDVTIADLAADARAPTPSAAAELAVPDGEQLRRQLERDWRRLCRAARHTAETRRLELGRERDALRALAPSARLAVQRARFDAAVRGLERATRERTRGLRGRLAVLGGRLHTLSPLAVLERGFAIVRRADDEGIARGVQDLDAGDRVTIRLARASLEAVVEEIRALPVEDVKPL